MLLEIIILICAIGIFVILARKLPDIVRVGSKSKSFEIEKKRISEKTTLTQASYSNLIKEADRLFEKGDFSGAEKLYIQTAARDPQNPKIYNHLGAIYLEMKNFQDAKEAFREAIRLNGKKASQYFNFSMACLELKEYRNAIEALEKAVRLDKKNKKYRQALKEARKKLS